MNALKIMTAAAVVVGIAGAAYAHGPQGGGVPGWGMGMMGPGGAGHHGQGAGMMGGMMGPGMMGSQGMMGPGMMGGMMSPGMMGGQGMQGMGMPCLQGAQAVDVNVETVRARLQRHLDMMGNPRLTLGDITENDGAVVAEIVTQDGSLVDRLAFNKQTGAVQRLP